MTRRGGLLFAALCVIWGIPYLLIKVAVRDLSPATLVFLRTALGALILVPLAVRRGQARALLPHWRALLAYTVAEIAIPWIFLSDAERRLSSSLSGLIVAAVPIVGAVLSTLTGGRERFDGRRGVGFALGLVGLVVLLGFDPAGADLRTISEMVLVVLGYAVGPMIVARRLQDAPALGVVAGSLVLAAAGYAPPGIAQLPATLPGPAVILSVLVLGAICTALAFVIFFELIAEIGPVRATVVAYVNPAVAVALGVLLLGEPFTAATLAGFVLILGGSFLATRPAGASPAATRRAPAPSPSSRAAP
ncbi:DMT family transporter [Anaeromyxobacter diazotrophicus]|uniref:Membrane protein n=1 Tax=Anaeromyxobacter diazotrophicus TaxID=2590199 RepID=A0A7I9VME1_9BACT|nr:DMT family transporter [Anaeromyxobacter diazotrophicus]GEJ57368.1 membrane protein [Anaeromyxobacter diazotrophicus]